MIFFLLCLTYIVLLYTFTLFIIGILYCSNGANYALSELEKMTEDVRKPVVSSWEAVRQHSATLVDNATYTYNKRKEYGPHIIGGVSQSKVFSTQFFVDYWDLCMRNMNLIKLSSFSTSSLCLSLSPP